MIRLHVNLNYLFGDRPDGPHLRDALRRPAQLGQLLRSALLLTRRRRRCRRRRLDRLASVPGRRRRRRGRGRCGSLLLHQRHHGLAGALGGGTIRCLLRDC